MPMTQSLSRVAVIGAGLAGAACAQGLRQGGAEVTLFEKSRGSGGRMATRRAEWSEADGSTQRADFDHGAQLFGVRHARFGAFVARAQRAGAVAPWRAKVHAPWPAGGTRDHFVPVPQMSALVRHTLGELPVLLQHTVQRLQRVSAGWQVVSDRGVHGPFDQVVVALPPAQAAVLLAGHRDDWADRLIAAPMAPCWTLMAVTDDCDWPWDAAEPARGPLAWVVRNDRKPGRSAPAGRAVWVAQARADWTAAHLDADAAKVERELCAALRSLLPCATSAAAAPRWHHSNVHRWRYAMSVGPALAEELCWWDSELGLGVAGDALSGPDIEAAWRSGDELADTVITALETTAPVHADEPVMSQRPSGATAVGRAARRPTAVAVAD
jgi:renalase